MRKIQTVIFLLAVACSGCATTKTVNVIDNGAIGNSHWNSRTHCNSLPRIYSGVAHNACFALFAERTGGAVYNSFEAGGYLLDAFASAVADTLVLPYTIYTHYQWGNIKVTDYREGERDMHQ